MSPAIVRHHCPCCGYDHLAGAAYAQLPPPPWLDHGAPPYAMRYGTPSYEVCACCGFEFGFDDDPGTAPPVSFEAFRSEWLAAGCLWFDPSKRPTAWSVEHQFSAASISHVTHEPTGNA